MGIIPQMFEIVYIDITDTDKYWDSLYRAASQERRDRADKFRFEADKKRCICAEALLRYCLEKSGISYRCAEIVHNEYGKPYIKDSSDFFFSLSHSGNYVAAAYGSSEVGADVEETERGDTRIAKHSFTASENEYINSSEAGAQERFIKLWTLKESYIKYLGTGLHTPLDSFSITVTDDRIFTETDMNLEFSSIKLDDRHYLAVCGKEKLSQIKKVTSEDCFSIL